MTFLIHDITTIVVNYRTLDLTRLSVESFLKFYPGGRMLLIDNGSYDDSTLYLQEITERLPNVQSICNAANIHHGPALHQGILACKSRFVFTMDSDCLVHRGGFLEAMLALLEEFDLYAIGRMERKQRFGFDVPPDAKSFIPYIHPSAMLLDKQKYFLLPPFFQHGSPCIRNMQAVQQADFTIRHFDVGAYIDHSGRGTCARYGYDLGLLNFFQSYMTYHLPHWLYRMKNRFRRTF